MRSEATFRSGIDDQDWLAFVLTQVIRRLLEFWLRRVSEILPQTAVRGLLGATGLYKIRNRIKSHAHSHSVGERAHLEVVDRCGRGHLGEQSAGNGVGEGREGGNEGV